MPKIETVMIKNEESAEGYSVINKSDFDEDTMELFEGEVAADDDSDKEPDGLTKEQAENQLKATSDEAFEEELEKMDADQCKKILDLLEVEYNKNLGVKKLREAVAEARSALTATE